MEIIIIVALLYIAAQTTYLVIQNINKKAAVRRNPVFVDTSVLIDGRIIAIAESGFLDRVLYVPRSVVGELQYMADNGDTEKRARARHGLDIIQELQAIKATKTEIFADGPSAKEGVDNRLLSLAKKHNGVICTIDYNLNKVAVVEGITVLNVNDLTKSLRMAYLPGERTLIELTQKGNDSHQAVGHLEDGTMVVVEHAFKQVGKTVEIEFIRSLQTAAGKMMFARLANKEKPAPAKKMVPKLPAVVQQVASKKPESQKSRPVQSRVVRTPQVQSEQPQVQASRPKPQQQQRPPRQNAPRQNQSNRRRSPEDSMVELANQ